MAVSITTITITTIDDNKNSVAQYYQKRSDTQLQVL
jgi:hypothetical protein